MNENVSSSSSLRQNFVSSNKDVSVVPIRRYYGKPWERLFDALPEANSAVTTSDDSKNEEKGKVENSLI